MLPTTYLGPSAWYEAFFAARRANEQVLIEVQESFVKQTYRNRCLIHDAQGHEVILTVPVLKVEHKQLTRDVQISYQQHWQHQHWMALRSAYGKSPYWDYYADYFAPFYERETKWLIERRIARGDCQPAGEQETQRTPLRLPSQRRGFGTRNRIHGAVYAGGLGAILG